MKNKDFLKWINCKKKIFLCFQWSVSLILVKIWTPIFTFYFCLINLWRKLWTYVLRIIRDLLLYVKIDFQVSLNFGPAKEILEIRCQIYILIKKVIILRKMQTTRRTLAPPFFDYFSLSLNSKKLVVMRAMRKKLQKQSVVSRYSSKWVFLKISQISQESTPDWSPFLTQLQACRLATLSRRDSTQVTPFLQNTSSGYFSNLKYTRFSCGFITYLNRQSWLEWDLRERN